MLVPFRIPMIAFLRRLCCDTAGAPAVEFAILVPVLLTLAFGALKFGIALNNYVMLTNGADASARILAISRGSSSPYTTATNQLYSSASTLTRASMTVTVTVNGSTCSADSACQTALNSAQGKAASVQVSYPCDLQVYKYNFAPSCSLSAQSTELVQ